MMQCKTTEEVDIYRTQTQLIIGWLTYNPVVVSFEVESAAARIGVDIHAYHFVLCNPRFVGDTDDDEYFEQWSSFLGRPMAGPDDDHNGSKSDKNRRIKVSVAHLVEAILTKSNKRHPYTDKLGHFVTFFSAFVALAPLFTGTAIFSPSYPHFPWPVVYSVVSMPVVQVMCVTNFLILVLTSSYDAKRRQYASTLLSELIRPTMLDTAPQIITGLHCRPKKLVKSFQHWWRRLRQHFIRHFVADPISSSGTQTRCEGNGDSLEGTKSADVVFGISGDSTWLPAALEGLGALHGEIDEGDSETPILNLEIPQNVYAWLYTRLILMTFGSRMLFRIQAYVGA
jgi:hypothetical protein